MADSASARTSLDDDVLSTARSDIAGFYEEQHKRKLESPDVPSAVHAGCTIYLGHKGLTSLPEELVDIIKDEVERLALNLNRLTSLSGLGPRFSECIRLKYLVMRDNELRDFPAPILSVPTLEVLDLKGNKIKTLPEDLNKLHNLRNFSIKRNRVERLPLCIGNMKNLMSFTTRRNDIQFPPREEWAIEEVKVDNDEDDKLRDTEREKLETQKLKKVLLEYAARVRKGSTPGNSDTNNETPRPLARRVTSGRFPIRPSVDLSTLGAPGSPPRFKPPPIPSKSNSRLAPALLTAAMRPGIEPLVSPGNERNRSNSESQMSQSSRASKRMGFMARKTSEQQVKFDVKKANRLSHNRGLSHGSALQNGVTANDSSSPTSPPEEVNRGIFGKRLSSLPEHKRKSRLQDPGIELAQGILFSMHLLHGPIKQLASLARDSGSKRSSLERTCFNTYSFVDELNKQLTALQTDEEDDDDERRKSSTSIQVTCESCVQAFEQLAGSLQRYVQTLVQSANPGYVRTLMHMLYASVIEIRNACSKFGVKFQSPARSSMSGSSRGRQQQHSPTTVRPTTSIHVNHPTSQIYGGMHSPRSTRSPRAVRNGLGVQQPRKYPNGMSRSTTNTSYSSMRTASESSSPFGTGPSPSLTRSNTMTSIDEYGEDQQFEQIFMKLSSACRYSVESMPQINQILLESRALAIERESTGQTREGEIARCDEALTAGKDFLDATEVLQHRLGEMRIKESHGREQLEFWQCVTSFTKHFTTFGRLIKVITQLGLLVNASPNSSISIASHETAFRDGHRTPGAAIRPLIKPIWQYVREAGRLITDSPWQSLAVGPGQAPLALPAKQLAFSPPNNSASSSFSSIGQASYQQGYGYSQHNAPNANYHHNSYSTSNYGYPPPSYNAHQSTTSRGTPPLSLQTRNMPPASASSSFNSNEPSSAVSTHSTSSQGFLSSGYVTPASGYVTPLPATPLSAALGPAAQATVPTGSGSSSISGSGGPQLQPPLFGNAFINGASTSNASNSTSSASASTGINGTHTATTGSNLSNGLPQSQWPERSRSLSQQPR